MNINAKIFKILARQLQWHMKKIIYCDQMVFIPGMWVCLKYASQLVWPCQCDYINRTKEKTHMIISTDTEERFDKMLFVFPLMINFVNRVVIEWTYFNV